MATTGINALLDMLAGCGVRHIFGNPGTTELPLNEAMLGEDRIRYILGLQEIPIMAMADGYAQASWSPSVVNLHISCGVGNAMGMLYNAYRANTPMIVTAGQQDRRLMFEEPILWGELVEVAKPWTKWAAEVQRIEDLPSAIRRAVQAAMTPPTGPVFLSIPLDIQLEMAELDLTPPQASDVLTRPPVDALHQATEILTAAKNPGILVGSRICEADAVDQLVAVAERLGAPVIQEATTSHGRCSFPSHHQLAAGALPFWSPQVRERLAEFDVLLVAGMKLMQQYIYHEPSRPIPESVRLVQFDDDPWELGKNYPVEVGVLGHPRASLGELAELLDMMMTPEQAETARDRAAGHAKRRFDSIAALQKEAAESADLRPLAPKTLMESLARVLPDNVAVVEESPTTTGAYLEATGALKNTSGYFAHRGWSLGWGLNCALGVQLAWPDRPVLGIIGDGSAAYGIQGLWSAAHYNIPATIVITNNTQYKILKDCAGVLGLPEAVKGNFADLDLTSPTVDYLGLAKSFGVEAQRVSEPDELSEAVRQSLDGDRPQLIEVGVRAD